MIKSFSGVCAAALLVIASFPNVAVAEDLILWGPTTGSFFQLKVGESMVLTGSPEESLSPQLHGYKTDQLNCRSVPASYQGSQNSNAKWECTALKAGNDSNSELYITLGSDPNRRSDTVVIQVEPSDVALSVSMTGPATMTRGSKGTFTVIVKNPSSSTVDVRLNHTYPFEDGFQFDLGSRPCPESDGPVCNFTLQGGASRTMTFTFTLAAQASCNKKIASSALASTTARPGVPFYSPQVVTTVFCASPVTIVSPNGGEAYTAGQNMTIRWSGGTDVVQIGLAEENFERLLGWITMSGRPDGSVTWNAEKVCDLAMVACRSVKALSNGPYRIVAVSKSEPGNFCVGDEPTCNNDLSDGSFTIVTATSGASGPPGVCGFSPAGGGRQCEENMSRVECSGRRGKIYMSSAECWADGAPSPPPPRTSPPAQNSIPPAGYEDEVLTNIDAYKNPFPDTNIKDLSGKAAAELYRRAVIGGFPDGQFKGDRFVNRAEAAKFLLLARYGSVADRKNDGRFPDVLDGQWYTRYVVTAAEKGIIKGHPNGLFKPADTVNTAEFLKMLALTFDLKAPGPIFTYRDVPAGAWFESYGVIAHDYGLFPDRKDYLKPNAPLTRTEVAVAIYTYLSNR